MRIGAISDIHLDSNSFQFENFQDKLISYIDDQQLDVLIIPGDIAGNKSTLENFFATTKDLDIPHKLYVPGNHCLWTNTEETSWELFLVKLPEMCKKHGWHFLPRNPIIVGKTVIMGTTGWYDYSTRNKNFDDIVSIDEYREKMHGNAMWMDREYIKFGMDDEKVSKLFLEQLDKDWNYLQNSHSSDIENIIVVSHIVPYADMVLHRNKLSWDFFSSFIGCTKLGKYIDDIQISKNSKKFSIFGHTHFPQRITRSNGVEAICVPLGYKHEMKNLDLEGAIARSFALIQI